MQSIHEMYNDAASRFEEAYEAEKSWDNLFPMEYSKESKEPPFVLFEDQEDPSAK